MLISSEYMMVSRSTTGFDPDAELAIFYVYLRQDPSAVTYILIIDDILLFIGQLY